MKLEKIHLFLILIFSLIFASSLGKYVRDGFTGPTPPMPDALKPVDTRVSSSGSGKAAAEVKYDPTINGGISASSVGSPVSALSPSTFPLNMPAGIPGMNSVSGNDAASGAAAAGAGAGKGEQCPPCPACARCPEPAFECKKVPNYSRTEDINAPKPVMADFSQFGM
jgi:hypothetical protein